MLLLQAILNIKSYLWLEISLFSASLFSPEAKHIRTCLSGQFTSHKKVNLLRCSLAHGPLSTLIPCTLVRYLEFQSATSLARSSSALPIWNRVPAALRNPRNNWADLESTCPSDGDCGGEGPGGPRKLPERVHSRKQSDWCQLICLLSIYPKCH